MSKNKYIINEESPSSDHFDDPCHWKIAFDEILRLYLVPAKMNEIYGHDDFVEMVRILKEMPEDHSFEIAMRDFYSEIEIEASKYWAILTAEKKNSTVNPACCLTGGLTNLRLFRIKTDCFGHEYENIDNLQFIDSSVFALLDSDPQKVRELLRKKIISNFKGK